MEFAVARDQLIGSLRDRIGDKRVLEAMRRMPRELFVPLSSRPFAYEDRPLPIGFDQTISQPYIVALMTQALEITGTEKVLEVGTGSGYNTAILAELVRSVISTERLPALAEAAAN
jgi:protein-L-isoaspartate(D-aspartate) O-methyltransferase